VRPAFVWAALDWPGYFALHAADLALAFLAPPANRSAHSAPRRGRVRRHRSAARTGAKEVLAVTAIFDPAGEVVAHSEHLVIEPRAD
jgi:hypothetical protein